MRVSINSRHLVWLSLSTFPTKCTHQNKNNVKTLINLSFFQYKFKIPPMKICNCHISSTLILVWPGLKKCRWGYYLTYRTSRDVVSLNILSSILVNLFSSKYLQNIKKWSQWLIQSCLKTSKNHTTDQWGIRINLNYNILTRTEDSGVHLIFHPVVQQACWI